MSYKDAPRQKRFFLNRYSFYLLCIITVVFLSHVLYVVKTRQYPQWDEHHYLSMAIKFYDIFQFPDFEIYKRVLDVSGSRQPLLGLLYALPIFIVGTHFTYKTALVLNGIFYIVSIVGVFFIARQYLDGFASLLAAIIFAFLGNNLFYLHFTYSETAVTTFIVLSFLFLLRGNYFKNRVNSMLAGVFFAAGFLGRWASIVFLAGPVLVATIVSIKNLIHANKNERAIVLTTISIFFLISVGIPAVGYYVPNFDSFYDYMYRNQAMGSEWVATYRDPALANTFSTRSIMYYFNIFSQNTIFLFTPFVIGFLFSLRRIRTYSMVIAGFVFSYCFFTFVTKWKEDRFIVPLYPYFAIISAIPIYYLTSKPRLLYALYFILFSLLVFFGAVWGKGPMGKRGLTDIVLPEFIHHPRRVYLTPLVWPPTKEYVNADLLVKAIQRNYKKSEKAKVLSLFEYEPLDNAIYSILSYHERNLMEYQKIFDADLMNKDRFLEKVGFSDYVLTKSSDILSSQLFMAINLGNFVEIANIHIPMDNSIVFVYRKVNDN